MKFLFLIILILNIVGIFSLRCKHCDSRNVLIILRINAHGELVHLTHVPVVMHGPGEKCGGTWNWDGYCAKGLKCIPLPGSQATVEPFSPRGKCASP
ncbi:hypothetical protein Anas_12729 [Armadillidium nasatum]|uniref:Uncharacterized protein n=1 Tax=Armadillidium nasatum TaxID=96803 RepID=A0A5N5SR88_9CRUS|nr:hypothetical protein Anas_12729 [Armadillidium nasatum]